MDQYFTAKYSGVTQVDYIALQTSLETNPISGTQLMSTEYVPDSATLVISIGGKDLTTLKTKFMSRAESVLNKSTVFSKEPLPGEKLITADDIKAGIKPIKPKDLPVDPILDLLPVEAMEIDSSAPKASLLTRMINYVKGLFS